MNSNQPVCTFTATKRVDTMALGPDRRMCGPGDKIEVFKWYCDKGPTSIKVNYTSHCVPFSWVMEAGAPANLKELLKGTDK